MRCSRRSFLGRTALAATAATTGTAVALGGQTKSASGKRGIAMTIGLNNVNPSKYPGAPPLRGCINDANEIFKIAKSRGFECSPTLIDKQATSEAVIKGIRQAAGQLKSGDIFLIQYAGHGGQVTDTNGDEAKYGGSEGLDSTWCLYDRQLIDDELGRLWTEFAPGVRILIISDSCHSGSVARGRGYIMDVELGGMSPRGRGDADDVIARLGGNKPVFRYMPDEVLRKNYQDHQAEYDGIQASLGTERVGEDESIQASVLLLSGCQDNQVSGDMSATSNSPAHGVFTARLLDVWNKGNFKGNYRGFHEAIQKNMPGSQSPNFYLVGQPNLRFWLQKPFTI